MSRQNRPGRNTAESKRMSAESVQTPEGVVLESEEEEVLWGQFTRARARGDWRDFDLILLHKTIRLEIQIRKHQKVLDSSGPLISNKRGTLIENPMLRVIDTLQRQQLSIIRSMSLTQTTSDPRAMNSSGLDAEKQGRVLKQKGPLSLLARPGSKL